MTTRAPGRPPFEPMPWASNVVKILRGAGVPLRLIARCIGCDVKTLRKAFKDELRDGEMEVEAAMGVAIVRAGLAGNWMAARYWLATHGGPQWRVTEARLIGALPDAPPVNPPTLTFIRADGSAVPPEEFFPAP